MPDIVYPPHIGFQVFQVGSHYRIYKHVREDGEMFFLETRSEFPGLVLLWASDDWVKHQDEAVLYKVHNKITEREAAIIAAMVKGFDPIRKKFNNVAEINEKLGILNASGMADET